MTWYVHRSGGKVASAHREPQPGYAEEALADDDAEIVALHAQIEQAKQRQRDTRDALAPASGPVTRAEIEAIKATVRELVS